ncbi:ImmA/IrrE family metallo-endopeptidase, partial [bacterium]|nr:ImmA/IrrE family metallo-endopeptidase [bacterium]
STKQEIKKILIRLGRQIKNLLALEGELGINFEESSPKMKLPIPGNERESNSQAEVLANKIRTSWNIGIDPVWNLEALLEQHSIILAGWHLPDELSGLCAPHEGRSVILIDSNEPKQRQRFSLCHELCHSITDISDGLVLTRKGYIKGGRDKYSYIENRADLFAGKLLLPLEAANAFANQEGLDLSNLTGYAAMRLAYNFGLSGLAVLHTLRSYGVISWSTLHKLEDDLYSVDLRDIQKRPPLEIWCDNLAQEFQSIPRLVRLGFHAYFIYKINVGALAELLDVPRSDLTNPLKEYKKIFSELLSGITAG